MRTRPPTRNRVRTQADIGEGLNILRGVKRSLEAAGHWVPEEAEPISCRTQWNRNESGVRKCPNQEKMCNTDYGLMCLGYQCERRGSRL